MRGCAEIGWLIDGYVGDRIPDYQMAAFLMAVTLRGMSADETAALTECLLRSGVILSWDDGGVVRVGKHSTGGIGDKVSLVLVPLLACSGVQVPKISGRGWDRRAARSTNSKPSRGFART